MLQLEGSLGDLVVCAPVADLFDIVLNLHCLFYLVFATFRLYELTSLPRREIRSFQKFIKGEYYIYPN